MKRILSFSIHFYRRYSPLFKRPCCRFYPSCSEYALLCLDRYNFFFSLWKIFYRIFRCNPFHSGGVDWP